MVKLSSLAGLGYDFEKTSVELGGEMPEVHLQRSWPPLGSFLL